MIITTYTNTDFKENVTHAIANRPYSLHRTDIPADRELVLYQHWHDEIELFYLEKGEVEFFIEDKCVPIKEGEAILIPPNLLHMALNTYHKNCCFYAFLFSPVLFSEAYTNSTYNRFVQPLKYNGRLYIYHFSGDVSWHNELLQLLRQIFLFYNRQDIDTWELGLHGLLFQLWNLYYNNHMVSIDLSTSYQKLNSKLKLSIDYIHEHYTNDLSLDLLARQSGLCKETFCRYFKKLTGESPFTYIIRYRIRKSCELLLNTEMKITQVASQCGFYNISYYNRTFMQYMKCKPSEYRRQLYKNTLDMF
ncbi:MAG: transcriptional regulator, AraC family [Herbinix sp.]|jgi:AraC-like DNA-binding protein/mannose-6-phosphate isomerase-like protein (cupin superfamily)|nr:transcriptional regulator, AraC family [Herbinix sp.]